jgi:hypothetical protein
MTKIISNVFVFLGAVVMLAALGLFSLGLGAVLVVLILGGAFICLGLSMKKLDKIEDKLGKFILLPKNEQKPLVTCEKCGRIYEAEYGRCPYCQ